MAHQCIHFSCDYPVHSIFLWLSSAFPFLVSFCCFGRKDICKAHFLKHRVNRPLPLQVEWLAKTRSVSFDCSVFCFLYSSHQTVSTGVTVCSLHPQVAMNISQWQAPALLRKSQMCFGLRQRFCPSGLWQFPQHSSVP